VAKLSDLRAVLKRSILQYNRVDCQFDVVDRAIDAFEAAVRADALARSKVSVCHDCACVLEVDPILCDSCESRRNIEGMDLGDARTFDEWMAP
jgi:hypothetical protein